MEPVQLLGRVLPVAEKVGLGRGLGRGEFLRVDIGLDDQLGQGAEDEFLAIGHVGFSHGVLLARQAAFHAGASFHNVYSF